MLIQSFECELTHHPDRRKGYTIGCVEENIEGRLRLCRERYSFSPSFLQDPGSERAMRDPSAGPVVCT
jgi:hypothetical protein